MKRLSVLLAGGLAVCAGLASAQQPQAPAVTTQANAPGGTIAGQVVEQGNGRPVRRASVTLRRVNTPTVATSPPVPDAAGEAGAAGTTAARGNSLGGIPGTTAAGQNRGGQNGLNGLNIQEALQNRGGRGGIGAGATAQTANDGTYAFTNVAPGEYTVAVTFEQYLSQEYGQRTLSGKGTPLAIQAGERLENINFQMLRAGVIVGTVVDEDGFPKPGIQVQALTYDYQDGRRVFRTVGSARTTDDAGGYRLYYLSPGDYYVTASPNNNNGANRFTGAGGGANLQGIQDLLQGLGDLRGGRGGQNPGGGRGAPAGGGGGVGGGDFRLAPTPQRGTGAQTAQGQIQNRGRGNRAGGPVAQEPPAPQEAYAPSFYPGTIDPAQAAAIHLGPGVEARGIDFSIRPVPLTTLSGVVLQAPQSAAATPPPAPAESARGRGAQPQTAAPRGGARAGTSQPGTQPGTPAPQAAPNTQNPARGGGANSLQGLIEAARGGGGQNLQDVIASLRDSGGLASLLAGGGLAGNGRGSVSLIPIGAPGRGSWAQNSAGRTTVNEAGEFQITGVTPGSYNLVATGRNDAGAVTAMQRVEVGSGGSITGLSLQLRPGMTVPGQVYVEGQTPETFRAQSMRIQLRPVDDLPGAGNATARIDENGAFVIQNVMPGAQYRVNASNIQNSGYVLAGRYGGVSALDAPIVVADEGTQLQLQIGFAPGRIETVVMDADKPMPGVITVLVPSARGRVDLYQTANSNKDGKVTFSNVPPGDYKLFAWEEIQSGAWYDPVLMEKFEDKGRLIHLEKAGAVTENVQMVRSETRF